MIEQLKKVIVMNFLFQGTDSLVLPFNAPLKNLDAFKKAIEDVISGREPESVDKNRQDNGNVASTSGDNFKRF